MPQRRLVAVAMLLRYTILLLMLQSAVLPSSRARHFAREKEEERMEEREVGFFRFESSTPFTLVYISFDACV